MRVLREVQFVCSTVSKLIWSARQGGLRLNILWQKQVFNFLPSYLPIPQYSAPSIEVVESKFNLEQHMYGTKMLVNHLQPPRSKELKYHAFFARLLWALHFDPLGHPDESEDPEFFDWDVERSFWTGTSLSMPGGSLEAMTNLQNTL